MRCLVIALLVLALSDVAWTQSEDMSSSCFGHKKRRSSSFLELGARFRSSSTSAVANSVSDALRSRFYADGSANSLWKVWRKHICFTFSDFEEEKVCEPSQWYRQLVGAMATKKDQMEKYEKAKVAVREGFKAIVDVGKSCQSDWVIEESDRCSDLITIEIKMGCNLKTYCSPRDGRSFIFFRYGIVPLTAAHELLHAFGVAHEQQRPDRDDYVTLIGDNASSADNEKERPYRPAIQTPYDYSSIMHYDSKSVKLTIKSKSKNAAADEKAMGNRKTLTDFDKEGIKILLCDSYSSTTASIR